jgi:WD40 repeat protein
MRVARSKYGDYKHQIVQIHCTKSKHTKRQLTGSMFTPSQLNQSSLATTPSSRCFVSGSDDKNLKLFDLNRCSSHTNTLDTKTTPVVRTFSGHTSFVNSVAMDTTGSEYSLLSKAECVTECN